MKLFVIRDPDTNTVVRQVFKNEEDANPIIEIFDDGSVYDVENGELLQEEHSLL